MIMQCVSAIYILSPDHVYRQATDAEKMPKNSHYDGEKKG